jgi:pimeloyl-ACP methyl ester carboxylesterase
MLNTESGEPTTKLAGGLAADDYGHADGRPPLVLLHGMTFDRTIWRSVVARLHLIDPGRRILAIDLPGHGQSPDQPSYELDHMPGQLSRSIEEAGIVAPVMVGHSAGALAATVYAAHRPTRGVINVDAPLEISAFAGLVQSLAEPLRGPGFAAVWQGFYDSFHTELLPAAAQELVRSNSRPRQEVVLGYWQKLLDGPTDEISEMIGQATAAIGVTGLPYLHIAGDEPGTSYREWLGEHLPAAAIEVWAGSGHFPHLARPDEFAQRLAATRHWAAAPVNSHR